MPRRRGYAQTICYFQGGLDTVLRFVSGEPTTAGGVSRREWLRIGGLAGLGLSVAALRAAAASSAARDFPGFGKAKSVILVYASGGQSQLDTWDPKPHAPEEIRGAFRTIATSVPGTIVCEHMPRLARLANRYTLVRSLSHDDLDHGQRQVGR